MKLSDKIFSNWMLFVIVVFITQDVLFSQHITGHGEAIKIGLLISNNKSIEAKLGAELAIQKANEKGGINGRPFQLITRSMDGPWGTGSKEAVNLVFKEQVWAILGSHNGRNAHLVEQVITKTRTVFLSAWATDPTLSQAFVPWYFSCVPNDNKQAIAIIDEIYKNRKINKVAIVSDNGYDSKLTLESFLKRLKKTGEKDPLQLFYTNPNNDFTNMLDKIDKAGVNGIVLLGQPSGSFRFIEQLQQKNMNQPVFGTLSLLGENILSDMENINYKNVIFLTSVNWFGSKGVEFKKEFQKKYDKIPGEVAAYAYDGMKIIIKAIRNSGFDREGVQKAMTNTRYEGITGLIQFDNKGNRLGSVDLVEIKNGIPAKL